MRIPIGKNRIRRGVAAAELAILLPFLVLMFGVAVDFCRVFYASQTVQNCAYAGALYASRTVSPRPDTSTATQAAQDAGPHEVRRMAASAPENRCHVSRSSASCLRPAAVRE